MKLRRLLFVPLVMALGGALLVLFGVIPVDAESPVDEIAKGVAVVSGGALSVLTGVEAQKSLKEMEHPEPEDPPRTERVIIPKDPISEAMEQAVEAVEQAEEFSSRNAEKVKIRIQIEEDDEDDVL